MPTYPKKLMISDPIQEVLLKKALTASIMASQIEKKLTDSMGTVPFVNPDIYIAAAQDLLIQLIGEDNTGELQWTPEDLLTDLN